MKVMVIVAGGLQPAYLGCYGNQWVETPCLDHLAAGVVVFDQHFADRPDALGARRAWRTGCYDFPLPAGQSNRIPPPADLLGLLREQKIMTSMVFDGSRPPPAEFTEGWDRLAKVKEESDLEAIVKAAGKALGSLKRRNSWLIWIELATLLPPWRVPDDFVTPFFEEESEEENEEEENKEGEAAPELTPLFEPVTGPVDPADDVTFERLQRTYAAAVSYVDTAIGQLLEELAQRGLAEQTLVLVTSDRGLPLGEHGIVGLCRPWLHEELVHLPLILRLPGGQEAGRRILALTQPVDLLPTLLEAFGIALPQTHGHSLWPLVRGEKTEVRPYACTGLQVGGSLEWSLRTPHWDFILPVAQFPGDPPRGPQLYVKPEDRWEVNDFRQHHPDLAEQMERTLRAFVAANQQPGPLVVPPLQPNLSQAN